MRTNRGFTLLEMTISTALFVAGTVYVYATFSGVTQSSKSATIQIDLGSQNKRVLTRLFSEMQASSLLPQDTDGIDSTEAEPVLLITDDTAAPAPLSKALVVTRRAPGTATTDTDGNLEVGAAREQAREKSISRSKSVRFRKVVGYQYVAAAGTIAPEWSEWITYRVDKDRRLVRGYGSEPPRPVAHDIDAFDVEARPDGTVIVTAITAKREPNGRWRRYANSVTIHPKN